MAIRAALAAWHYIFGSGDQPAAASRTVGGSATPAARTAFVSLIVANLKEGKRQMDAELCPVALRNHCAVHVDFKMKIIKRALDRWPSEYRGFSARPRRWAAACTMRACTRGLGFS
jgi:hypothetical protein